jgi:hypothetical protein
MEDIAMVTEIVGLGVTTFTSSNWVHRDIQCRLVKGFATEAFLAKEVDNTMD